MLATDASIATEVAPLDVGLANAMAMSAGRRVGC